MLRRTAPDVVLLDYHLPDGDGLIRCRQMKHLIPAPRVIVYSAHTNDRLRLAAIVAGAGGALNTSAPHTSSSPPFAAPGATNASSTLRSPRFSHSPAKTSAPGTLRCSPC
jgi:CheY-like chemotaxis protein